MSCKLLRLLTKEKPRARKALRKVTDLKKKKNKTMIDKHETTANSV